MKAETIKRFVSMRDWAIGLHVHGSHTLVVLIGAGWAWSFSSGHRSTGKGYVFGLCVGPLTVGFCQ